MHHKNRLLSLRPRSNVLLLGTILFVAGFALAALPSKPQGYVTDEARIIPAENRAAMEQLLTQLEQKTSAEIAVVTVSSLDGNTIEEYAVDLFKKWGIGKKGKDNGLLFLVAPTERKMRIEVGYGLEAVISDGKAGRIRDNAIIPFFRNGQYAEGIESGTWALANEIARADGVSLENGHRAAPSAPQKSDKGGGLGLILFLIFLFFVVFRHPWLLFFLGSGMGRSGRSGGGGFSGGGFGGFGGGGSGGGGASGSW